MYPVGQAALEYYRSGAHKSQRFGQFYYNRYIHDGKPWPELFYETDAAKCIEMICEREEAERFRREKEQWEQGS